MPLDETRLQVRRILDAPRERVFRAWTDPRWIAHWWGPPDMNLHIDVDLHVGGQYRYTVTEPDGHQWYLVGAYQEVIPPVRLVYTWAFENSKAQTNPVTLVTVDFVDRGHQTEVILTHERFEAEEPRNAHLGGWEMCLDRIEVLLLHPPTME